MPGYRSKSTRQKKIYLLLVLASIQLLRIDADAAATPTEAYRYRGQQIELAYQSYTTNLQVIFEQLRAVLVDAAPNLLFRLDREPPNRRDYGYQILPRIISESSAVCGRVTDLNRESSYRPRSNRFSWPITQSRIERELARIDKRLGFELAELKRLPVNKRAAELEQRITEYLDLKNQYRKIDKLIQHNWLWQREVSNRKPHYLRATRLHNIIVEHSALTLAQASKKESDYRQALKKTQYANSLKSRADLNMELKHRTSQLAAKIRNSSRGLMPRDYVKVQQPRKNFTLVTVSVYTDIDDIYYLRRLADAIEKRWCLDDAEEKFRLQISFDYIEPKMLYASTLPTPSPSHKTGIPETGAALDLRNHCGRFPRDGARLSSGAKSTHILAGCMYLGPEEVNPGLLAHEFGHLLGFADEYVRGFRNLDEAGFEILEILADNENIMSSHRMGRVHRYHYDALIAGEAYRNFYRQAVSFMNAEQYTEAIRYYRHAIEASYNDKMAVDAYNNLGWSLAQQNRFREAIAAYTNALRARPDYTRARNNLRSARARLKAGVSARDF